jgi:hypothetical protein
METSPVVDDSVDDWLRACERTTLAAYPRNISSPERVD